MASFIYTDLESLIKRIGECKNNPEKSSTTKLGEHITCGYSISTIWVFDGIENKHDLCRGEDCMKYFCRSLREHAMKMINIERKKMMPLRNKEYKSHLNQLKYNISKKNSNVNTLMIKIIPKLKPLYR